MPSRATRQRGRVAVEWTVVVVMPRRSRGSAVRSNDKFTTEARPGGMGGVMSTPPRIRFACPLCRRGAGRTVMVTGELDPAGPSAIIADLSGCPHADGFGEVGRLTLDEERMLIGAALDAVEARQLAGRARRERPGA